MQGRSPSRARGGLCGESSRTVVAATTALLVGVLLGAGWSTRRESLRPERRAPIHDFAGVVEKTADCGPPPRCDCDLALAAMERAQCPTVRCATEDESGAPIDLASFYAHDDALRPGGLAPVAGSAAAATGAGGGAAANHSVCMVVRTYAGHRNTLMAMLASVLLWDHPRLTVHLVDTGKEAPFRELPRLAAMASAMAGRPDAVRVSRWRHANSRAAFPGFTAEDHGYIATDLTLEDILAERAARDPALQELLRATGAADADAPPPVGPPPCDLMIVTNGDNLYGKEFLAAALGEVATGAEMVSTHWVSHYDMDKAWILGWGEIQNGHCGPWRPGRDGEVAASPVFKKGCVDLGVVTFKTALLEESGFRFAVDRLRTVPKGQAPPKGMFEGMDSLFYADGSFFERLYVRFQAAGQTSKARMLRRALFVHQ